jgi:alpha-glucosidase (family GH31 glycosyl hydrolase)
MPELYTTMVRASQRGHPAVRSLWFDFPSSFDTLRGTDTQYMFGNLLVSSVLEVCLPALLFRFEAPC